MAEFLTPLETRKTSRNKWALTAPLVYRSDIAGVGDMRVPIGFRTDYASVPRIPLFYMVDGDTAHEAAVVHDYLYYIGMFPRDVADAVFREACIVSGEGSFRAWRMFVGVRVGGWKAWNKYRRRR